jgi:hypothetical protein
MNNIPEGYVLVPIDHIDDTRAEGFNIAPESDFDSPITLRIWEDEE